MSEQNVLDLVAGFEALTLSNTDFDHAAHLTVATYYVEQFGEVIAAEKMCAGLKRFAAHHGATKLYHETITQFWVRMVAAACAQLNDCGLAQKAVHVVEVFGRKEVLFDYYSRDHVMSESARNGWVEPDLKPIPSLRGGLKPAVVIIGGVVRRG